MRLHWGPWVLGRTVVALLFVLASLGWDAALDIANARGASMVMSAAAPGASAVVDTTRQASAVQYAFDLLFERYVHSLDSATLLGAAWGQIVLEAEQRKAPAPEPAPVFTGDRAADSAAFRSALVDYLTRNPSLPNAFVPAHAAIRGMAAFVNEGHTYFLDPQQYQEHLAWTRGQVKYAGIGARMRGPEPTVTEVFQGSPAERAGLRVGDVLIRVNTQSVAGLSLDKTISLLRGPEGTVVELVVRRPGLENLLTIPVERAQITLEFLTHRMLDDQVGYIRLRGFPEPSVVDRFEQSMADLTSQGMQGLVLDLRGNSGGRLDVGSRLLSFFLPPGTSIYQQVDRGGNTEARTSREGTRYSLPLVVLVDGNTASMGEITAAALQEQGVATIVGKPTAGSVAAGQVFALGDGSALQVTVLEIRSGAGKQLNGTGVTPDEVIEADPLAVTPEKDQALDRAITLVREATQGVAPAQDTPPQGAEELPIAV
jgi:carboxyl-terminal processing protease